MTTMQSAQAWARAQIPAGWVYGTVKRDLQMETGTFDADVTTGQNGDRAARLWSNTADGEGRWVIDRLPYRSVGDVVIRIVFAVGASGGSGDNTKWRLDYEFQDNGDQYPTSMAKSIGVTKDMNGLTVRTDYAVDFTVPEADWNQAKEHVSLHIIRLAGSDAVDNYLAGTFYQHKLLVLFTGYGPADSVLAAA